MLPAPKTKKIFQKIGTLFFHFSKTLLQEFSHFLVTKKKHFFWSPKSDYILQYKFRKNEKNGPI